MTDSLSEKNTRLRDHHINSLHTLCLVYTLVPWYFSNFESNFDLQLSTAWKVLNDSPSSSGGDLSAPNPSETKVNCTPGGNRWEPTWSALRGKFQRRILYIVSSFKSQHRIRYNPRLLQRQGTQHLVQATRHTAHVTIVTARQSNPKAQVSCVEKYWWWRGDQLRDNTQHHTS